MLNFGKSWNPEDNLISMGKSFIINTSSRERKKKKQGKMGKKLFLKTYNVELIQMKNDSPLLGKLG